MLGGGGEEEELFQPGAMGLKEIHAEDRHCLPCLQSDENLNILGE